MGRAERRKAGIKEKVKTYNLTLADIQKIKKDAADEAYNRIMESIQTEINQQILDSDRAYNTNLDAAILWTLHTRFGFGRKRLRRFWEAFLLEHEFLRAVYGDGKPASAKFREYLADIKVDIAEWEKETYERKRNENGTDIE